VSVIEAALRRAQMQDENTARTQPPADPDPDHETLIVTHPRRGTRGAPRRRMLSPATGIIIVLAVTAGVVIGQPQWTRSVARWFDAPPPVAQMPRVTALTGQPEGSEPASRKESAKVGKSNMAQPAQPAAQRASDARATTGKSQSKAKPAGGDSARVVPPKLKTEPDGSTRVSHAGFELGGVMISGQSRLAIINGGIVGEGQMVGRGVVESIGSSAVTIRLAGRVIQIPVRPDQAAAADSDPAAKTEE
jgi:hypothetical protein